MGLLRMPSEIPSKMLQIDFFSFEAHPSCRLVREALCILELPWTLHPVGFGSGRRFPASAGNQLLWLCDSNTGFASGDADAIVEYLIMQYSAGESEKNFDMIWVWRQRFASLGRGLNSIMKDRV